jgi:uncharacterized membrane-anchored protein
MTFRERLRAWCHRTQEIALCIVRKWWRPITCVGIAGGTIINLCIIPLRTRTTINLAEGAAWIGACAAAFAVREVGKRWGTATKDNA